MFPLTLHNNLAYSNLRKAPLTRSILSEKGKATEVILVAILSFPWGLILVLR